MSPQLDTVSELETLKTHVDNSGCPSLSTLGQRHQSGEASKLSPNGSPSKEDEHHGEHSNHKKSLLSKMKDKAKKLQHSLSGNKRHDEEGGDATFSPRDRSKNHKGREEGEVEEENPEYLGAPMYESKKAPEELKETARQHPRETHVLTETNVLSVLPPKQNAEHEHKECISPNKTVTETVTETLAPAYAKVSEATHAITKKIQDMSFSESTEVNDVSVINTKVWDKGVSVKEYISQTFEPGEDDRALSQVISKAIIPSKASSDAATHGGATKMVTAPNSSDNKAPLLANTNEIVEEENHGRMLQPN